VIKFGQNQNLASQKQSISYGYDQKQVASFVELILIINWNSFVKLR